ncbi:MAG: outer membrane beta-barrel domain-containing protein [Deltaproteobacteria bacterium]|nr:MAG: outer membrane beta-barrel domain-containing protein [Deltaproteobacteria bacterium]
MSFHRRAGVVLCGLLVSAMLSAGVRAAQIHSERYGPIQKRLFDMSHELSIGFAYLPLDPYYKGYGVQLAYTIHFDQMWALELFRVGFSYNTDTSLKTKLIQQIPDISPGEFPAVELWENTNLVFKFFYGKQSFLNRQVLHFELFATAGASILYANPYPIWEGNMHNAQYQFGVNVGFGARFWLDPRWSVRLDLRDTVVLIVFNQGRFPLDNVAMIGLSFCVDL